MNVGDAAFCHQPFRRLTSARGVFNLHVARLQVAHLQVVSITLELDYLVLMRK